LNIDGKSNPNSIFKSLEGEQRYMKAYQEVLNLWPVPYETFQVPTTYGSTHIIACGPADAAPLVLLHGMLATSTMWYPNIEALSKSYRVYAVDIIGDFGRSKVTRPLRKKEDCVKWLCEILDALHIKQADFVGHSMGGWLTLNFALHSPQYVKRIVLLAPAGGILRVNMLFFLKVYKAILFPSEANIQRMLQWFYAEGNQPDLGINRLFIEGIQNCRPRLSIFPSLFEDSQLRKLQVPTLFLVGDQEVIYSSDKAVKRVLSLVPCIEAEIIKNASHCLTVEQSHVINNRIVEFLVR
jgi:pimeloyl-ACP methyl ester carboxylesterase